MTITPDKKDLERAKKFYGKSDNQISANINAIKDPNKLLRRGVAWAMVTRFSSSHKIVEHAQTLNIPKEEIEEFEKVVKEIEASWRAQEAELERIERLRVKPLMDFLSEKVESKIKKFSITKLHNQAGWRKGVYSDLKVVKFNYDFDHFLGFGKRTQIRVWISLEYLSCYFYREAGGFYLEMVERDGKITFNRQYSSYTPTVTLGKKDSNQLKELLKLVIK